MRVNNLSIVCGVIAAFVVGSATRADARDFFSSFFGALTGQSRPVPAPAAAPQALPFAADVGSLFGPPQPAPAPRVASGAAYCVRTCDGRYFPLVGSGGNQSRASTCSNLCPAADTKVFYGGTIDNATAEGGKPYTSLTNAFRYRNELVSGCTCNGKDPMGLARIKAEDDPTLRRGDLVVNEKGRPVAANVTARNYAANYSPAVRSSVSVFKRAPEFAAAVR